MKVAVIVYHKNAQLLYPKQWLEEFKHSIENQTYKDFEVFENNYGGDDFFIMEGMEKHGMLSYTRHSTFVDSMNFLLERCFYLNYDYVFNTNVDDYFAFNRIEKQLVELEKGYDLVASNFHLIRDDKIVHSHRMNEQNIGVELSRNNNPIGHPVVAYSRNFWEKYGPYIPSEIPTEDLNLWQRAYKKGATIKILPDFLLFHRLHNNSVCQNENNR